MNLNGLHFHQWFSDNHFLDFDLVAAEGPTRPSSGSHIDFFLISSNFRAPSHLNNNIVCRTLNPISDHFAVLINIQLQNFIPFPPQQSISRCFKNTNWQNFNRHLESQLENISLIMDRNLPNNEIDYAIQELSISITNTIAHHSKIKTYKPHYLNISQDPIRLFKTRKNWKSKLKRIFHRSGDRTNQEYSELSARINCLSKIIKDKVRIELNYNFRAKLKSLNPSCNVFKTINQITSRKSQNNVPMQNLIWDNRTFVNPTDKVEAFGHYYAELYAVKTPFFDANNTISVNTFNTAFSIWTNDLSLTNFTPDVTSDSILPEPVESKNLVESVIKSLNNKKSTGPDLILNFVIRKASLPLAKFLTPIFNNCINNCNFPQVCF